MSEITAELQDEIYEPLLEQSVEENLSGYSNELTYHWRPHGERVVDRNIYNRDLMICNGIEVPSLYVTMVAASAHDRGFFEYFTNPTIKRQFASPEDYAIYLVTESQRQKGVDEQTCQEIGELIKPTKVGVSCRSWGAFGLCEADLHSTTLLDRTQMKLDTLALHQEHLLLKGSLNEQLFKLFSIGILATYNLVNLNFAEIGLIKEFDDNHKRMRENILLMGQDIYDETGQELKDLVHRISPPFIAPVLRLFGIKKGEIETEETTDQVAS